MKQRTKFKIALLFCHLARYRIFDPLTFWYLRKKGFDIQKGGKE